MQSSELLIGFLVHMDIVSIEGEQRRGKLGMPIGPKAYNGPLETRPTLISGPPMNGVGGVARVAPGLLTLPKPPRPDALNLLGNPADAPHATQES